MGIIRFLKPVQKELFMLIGRSFSNSICKKGKYILVKGEAPVMLVAHLDTVHKQPVKTICTSNDGNLLMSPEGIGGDDRCGVYALCMVYKSSVKKPWLLFTCDEEIGCIGASDFARDYEAKKLPEELGQLKLIIEVDRKGSNDAVYYDCYNPEFEDYITSKGFKTAHGSVSDISYVAPALKVAAVNLSSGYYNAHTQHEYINLLELDTTIAKINEIVAESVLDDMPQFVYDEIPYDYGWYYGCYGRGLYLDDGADIKSMLTEEQKGMYEELLEIFGAEELDSYIMDYGPEIISDIYEDEIRYSLESITDEKSDNAKETNTVNN